MPVLATAATATAALPSAASVITDATSDALSAAAVNYLAAHPGHLPAALVAMFVLSLALKWLRARAARTGTTLDDHLVRGAEDVIAKTKAETGDQ